MTATAGDIIDRISTLIESVVPTTLAENEFRRLLAEGNGDAREWASNNPAGALRRFLARDVGDEEPPAVDNTLVVEVELDLEIVVCYPQTARYGKSNSTSRDVVIGQDWEKINNAIGIRAAGNFSGANDCTPLGCSKSVERAGKVDFLVIRGKWRFWRSTT